jgi:hypothetical protein
METTRSEMMRDLYEIAEMFREFDGRERYADELARYVVARAEAQNARVRERYAMDPAFRDQRRAQLRSWRARFAHEPENRAKARASSQRFYCRLRTERPDEYQALLDRNRSYLRSRRADPTYRMRENAARKERLTADPDALEKERLRCRVKARRRRAQQREARRAGA